MEFVLNSAGNNRIELEKVIEYYKNEPLKQKAAKFLIENMAHYSQTSSAISKYRNVLLKSDNDLNSDSLWSAIKSDIGLNDLKNRYDITYLSADYLIQNIDEAFAAWKDSLWHDKINFDAFCNYILPYRVLTEPVTEWRTALKNEYSHLIANITDPEVAFSIIYKHVFHQFDKREQTYPYERDVMLLDKIKEGACSNRCVYIISVLRSLGIPAAYDCVGYWANFSPRGHVWVAYAGNNGMTKTMLISDSIPKENKEIDAAIFRQQEFIYNKSGIKMKSRLVFLA